MWLVTKVKSLCRDRKRIWMNKGSSEHNIKTTEELEVEIREFTSKRKDLIRQIWNIDSELIARKEILYQRRQISVEDISGRFDDWDD